MRLLTLLWHSKKRLTNGTGLFGTPQLDTAADGCLAQLNCFSRVGLATPVIARSAQRVGHVTNTLFDHTNKLLHCAALQTLEDVLTAASNHARIVACGQISQYDAPEAERYGVKNLFNVSLGLE